MSLIEGKGKVATLLNLCNYFLDSVHTVHTFHREDVAGVEMEPVIVQLA